MSEPVWVDADDPISDDRLAEMSEGIDMKRFSAQIDGVLAARELLDRRRGLWKGSSDATDD